MQSSKFLHCGCFKTGNIMQSNQLRHHKYIKIKWHQLHLQHVHIWNRTKSYQLPHDLKRFTPWENSCPTIFYLKTMGEGTQNLTRILWMFSCKLLSSNHHAICSLADPPAVGSGAPDTWGEMSGLWSSVHASSSPPSHLCYLCLCF